jgi:hypothetical protein
VSSHTSTCRRKKSAGRKAVGAQASLPASCGLVDFVLEIVERHVPAEQREVVLLDLVACAPALAPLLLPGWASALRH